LLIVSPLAENATFARLRLGVLPTEIPDKRAKLISMCNHTHSIDVESSFMELLMSRNFGSSAAGKHAHLQQAKSGQDSPGEFPEVLDIFYPETHHSI
jgi:hypothetical protein